MCHVSHPAQWPLRILYACAPSGVGWRRGSRRRGPHGYPDPGHCAASTFSHVGCMLERLPCILAEARICGSPYCEAPEPGAVGEM